MGITNIELEEIAKDLSIPSFYCICKDELNARIIDPTNQCPTENIPINIIVKLTDLDNTVNGHLCLIFITDYQ